MQNPSSMDSKSVWYFSSESRNASSARLRSVTSRTVARSPPTSGSSKKFANVPSTQRHVPSLCLTRCSRWRLKAGAVFGVHPLDGVERQKLLGRVTADALGGGAGVDDRALSVAYGDHLRDVGQEGPFRRWPFSTSYHDRSPSAGRHRLRLAHRRPSSYTRLGARVCSSRIIAFRDHESLRLHPSRTIFAPIWP